MESLLSIPYLPVLVGLVVVVVAVRLIASRGFSMDEMLGKLLGPSYADGKLLREVERLKQRGDHLTAGRLLEDSERLDLAQQAYVQGKEFYAAASVLERMGRHERAAELYLQAGDTKKAAQEFTAAGKAARAAVLFLEKGNNLEAAKLFGTAGLWDRAADLFLKSGYASRAGEAYEKAGDRVKAAEAYERHFLENVSYSTTYSSTAVSPDQKMSLRAGQLFLEAGETARALDVLVKGGYFAEAGDAALARGEYPRAAELFLRADDTERAAGAWDRAGNVVQAALLRGEMALKKDQPVEAARCFEQGRDFLRAAELYESAGQLREAAAAYVASDSHAAAGSVFVRARMPAEAAAAYERAGEYETAGQLYLEAGKAGRAAELLERAGQLFRAGEIAHASGDSAQAIALLQRVPADDENYLPATKRLAELLVGAGRGEVARERLLKVLGTNPPGPGNLDLHYLLAAAHEAAGDRAAALALFKKIEAEDLRFKDVGARVKRLESAAPAAPAAAPAASSAAPPPAAPAARPAEPAQRFALREEIGRGPLGVVHRGEEPSGRAVAMRLLPDRYVADATLLLGLAGDIKAAAQLSNPHLTKVLALIDLGGKPCVIGEYVQGRNLAEPLKSGAKMAVQQVHSLGRVLAQTLAYLHGKGIAHGSVQPSNVIVAAGTVKLMDIGLGRLAQTRRPEESYRAPGAPLDATADLFDLVTLLYHLLTGVHPRTLPQGVALPLPSSFTSGVPESMDRLLVRGLHPREDLRAPTADALLAELREMVRIS